MNKRIELDQALRIVDMLENTVFEYCELNYNGDPIFFNTLEIKGLLIITSYIENDSLIISFVSDGQKTDIFNEVFPIRENVRLPDIYDAVRFMKDLKVMLSDYFSA
jgi:hypothetical protein